MLYNIVVFSIIIHLSSCWVALKMVKLTGPNEQAARSVGERERGQRTHHNWGARFGRRRHDAALRTEPTTLLELETLAKRAVNLMESFAPKSIDNYTRAMDLLRQQYNLVIIHNGFLSYFYCVLVLHKIYFPFLYFFSEFHDNLRILRHTA